MIVKLKGIIEEIGSDFVVLDVSGVGYYLMCSEPTVRSLPGVGEACCMFTEMLSGDAGMRLIGFASACERDWFRALHGVQGVGVKVALSVLSALTVENLQRAIYEGDKNAICRAQGVGAKVAQRILHELKDKKISSFPFFAVSHSGQSPSAPGGIFADAVSALVKLGYNQHQASEAVEKARSESDEDASLETLLRIALQGLSV